MTGKYSSASAKTTTASSGGASQSTPRSAQSSSRSNTPTAKYVGKYEKASNNAASGAANTRPSTSVSSTNRAQANASRTGGGVASNRGATTGSRTAAPKTGVQTPPTQAGKYAARAADRANSSAQSRRFVPPSGAVSGGLASAAATSRSSSAGFSPISPGIPQSKYAERIEMQIKNTPDSQRIDVTKPIPVEVLAPFSPPVSQGGLDTPSLMLVEQNYRSGTENTVSRGQPTSKSTNFDNVDSYYQSLQGNSMMTMTVLLIQ